MAPATLSDLFRSRPRLLLIIFVSALSLKLLILFLVTDPIPFYKYPYFAARLNKGLDIGERILDLSPLYLYVHVLAHKIYGENWEALLVLQILLGSLNCLFIYLIGEKIFGPAVGFIAALFLLLYGNLTLIELTLEPEVFVLFLNSLLIFILLKGQSETGTGRKFGLWFLAGLVAGLATITKANALLLLPVALVWIWLGPSSHSQRIKSMLLLLLGTALIISPITLRNYIKFQDVVLITADAGKVFFHGNGPGSTGMERADLPDQGFIEEGQLEPDYAHALFRKTARALAGRHLKPSECSQFWFSRTWNHMQANPLSAFILEVKKFFYFWGNYEVHDIDSIYKNYQTIQNWPLLPFGVIAALGILGMYLSRKDFRRAFLLYAAVGVYLLSVLIFFAASRYRLPAAPFLSIFAAYAFNDLFGQWREKRLQNFFICIGLVFSLLAGNHYLFRKDIEALDRWQRATRIHYSLGGNLLFQRGFYREATLEFQKAIDLEPHFAPAHNRLGMAYAILGDFEKAEKHFKKVIELSPGIDWGYLNLGLLYELREEAARALPLLEKAFSLNPENPKTKEHLYKLRAGKSQG